MTVKIQSPKTLEEDSTDVDEASSLYKRKTSYKEILKRKHLQTKNGRKIQVNSSARWTAYGSRKQRKREEKNKAQIKKLFTQKRMKDIYQILNKLFHKEIIRSLMDSKDDMEFWMSEGMNDLITICWTQIQQHHESLHPGEFISKVCWHEVWYTIRDLTNDLIKKFNNIMSQAQGEPVQVKAVAKFLCEENGKIKVLLVFRNAVDDYYGLANLQEMKFIGKWMRDFNQSICRGCFGRKV